MRKPLVGLFCFGILLLSCSTMGQSIASGLPRTLDKSGKYLFYLHGGVVTVFGNNAVNQSVPEWGPYEYLNILDSLASRGFNVISENRTEDREDAYYEKKIARQVDSLFKAGIKSGNILVIGASAGAAIAVNVSAKLKNGNMKYVVMGGCWPDTYKDYRHLTLYGHFLSIIESTDPHGTCGAMFGTQKRVKSYQEITLHTGLSHGFIYKGYKEWIDPIVEWFESH